MKKMTLLISCIILNLASQAFADNPEALIAYWLTRSEHESKQIDKEYYSKIVMENRYEVIVDNQTSQALLIRIDNPSALGICSLTEPCDLVGQYRIAPNKQTRFSISKQDARLNFHEALGDFLASCDLNLDFAPIDFYFGNLKEGLGKLSTKEETKDVGYCRGDEGREAQCHNIIRFKQKTITITYRK